MSASNESKPNPKDSKSGITSSKSEEILDPKPKLEQKRVTESQIISSKPDTGFRGSTNLAQRLQRRTFVHTNVPQDLRERAEKYLPELESMHIKLGRFIGEGKFGSVVKGFYMEIKEIAVKICSLTNNKHVKEGMAIAREFKHDNIIGIIHTLEKSDVIFIVMPFADTDMFEDFAFGAFSQYDTRIMCRQVLSGLQYMHSKRYAHRDIKLENILIFKSQQKYKICDLDTVTKVVDEKGSPIITERIFGTKEYMPPELLLKQRVIDLRTHDVWSFGILAHTSVTFTYAFGNIIYKHKNFDKKIKRMEKHNIKYPPGCDTSKAFEDFVRECLVYDPTERPTVDVLLQNPWFAITIPENHDRFLAQNLHHGMDRNTNTSTASLSEQSDPSKCCQI